MLLASAKAAVAPKGAEWVSLRDVCWDAAAFTSGPVLA